ncbi:hypothetical protein [Mycolicibacterium goodii]|uniref:hypothetical protein n=1 Tax=Mycolicibacterium goodii TaxID=134601 RepID=UPI001BDBEF35|nr:hypothetical protein [Mycolicibacterium goodii]MBU8833637.1 hypothetical protein [Mycolicibacterium goodii]
MEPGDVVVIQCDSPIFGRTYQPVERFEEWRAWWRGGHYASKARAEAAAREHVRRANGLAVTVR